MLWFKAPGFKSQLINTSVAHYTNRKTGKIGNLNVLNINTSPGFRKHHWTDSVFDIVCAVKIEICQSTMLLLLSAALE